MIKLFRETCNKKMVNFLYFGRKTLERMNFLFYELNAENRLSFSSSVFFEVSESWHREAVQ
jgi:hypothetical protein